MTARTQVAVFESTLQKTHEWLDELVQIGHFEDESQAYSALRAVLHALRDRLMVDEAVHLAAQFPMIIRGFYFEGWKPAVAPSRDRHLPDFLEHIQQSLRNNRIIDPMHAARSVFALLNHRIAAGEISDVRSMLPRELREIWPNGEAR